MIVVMLTILKKGSIFMLIERNLTSQVCPDIVFWIMDSLWSKKFRMQYKMDRS